ncbi:MAG: TGS domain-containing protein [Nitrospiraceae bacterium]|nr:TGS domain-containing protein [Nitrospiraceae bacterium]
MPTNLPPEYYDADERYRAAVSPVDKIACLEELLTTIPKHKGTDHLRADYRKRLSKLKATLDSQKKSGKHTSVYHIEKEGPARVVVVGAPNVGKSALLAALTHARPKVSEYPFTTWTPTPGMMPVRDTQIQLIDTPALSPEHIEPELFGLIRTADFVLLVVDLQARPLRQLDDTVSMLEEHRIRPGGAECKAPERKSTAVLPCVVLVNKDDDESWDEEFEVFDELLENRWPLLRISAETGRNLDALRELLFERLGLMRIYSKQPGKEVDRSAPFVLKQGATVAEFAERVHKDFLTGFKTARIWGTGVHDGQQVGRDHVLYDGDIVELHT